MVSVKLQSFSRVFCEMKNCEIAKLKMSAMTSFFLTWSLLSVSQCLRKVRNIRL